MRLALQKLRNLAQTRGYLTEEEVFDASEALNINLRETEDLIGTLIEEGINILEEEPESVIKFSSEEDVYDKSQIDYQGIFDEVVLIEPNLSSYIDRIKQILPPQKNEEFTLIPLAKMGNLYAKERIICMFLKVVIREALYFHKATNFPLSDAIQEGAVGLIIAIDKYEIKPGHRFSAYAPLWIRQNMGRAYNNNGRTIRLPVYALELLEKIKKIQRKFEFENNRKPTILEIIIEINNLSRSIENNILYERIKLEIGEEKIQHLLIVSQPALSLSELLTRFDDGLIDIDAIDPSESAEYSFLRRDIKQALSLLPDRERQILEMRFGLINGELTTLEQIGNDYNVTRERVRQIEYRALAMLRNSHYQDLLSEYL